MCVWKGKKKKGVEPSLPGVRTAIGGNAVRRHLKLGCEGGGKGAKKKEKRGEKGENERRGVGRVDKTLKMKGL